MPCKKKKKNFVMVRSILGTDIFKDTSTGKEYLADYTKKGKNKLVLLK